MLSVQELKEFNRKLNFTVKLRLIIYWLRKKVPLTAKMLLHQRGKMRSYLLPVLSLGLCRYTLLLRLPHTFIPGQTDQSLLSRSDVWNSLVPVENGGGKIGFFWANLLLSKLFGLGAFIIPFFFLGVSIYCLNIKKVNLLRLFFVSAFGAIILSVFCSYVFWLY